MGSIVKNIGGAVSNLSKGKNILGSAISLSSGGLIGSGEDTQAPSFEQRMNQLETAGAFGGLSAKDYTSQQQKNAQQGLGYSTIAAENAKATMLGQTPSVAELQFKRGLDQSIAASASQAQNAPVDSALAYRIAQDSADQQRQAAIVNQALLRANEVASARGELGQLGGQINSIASQNEANARGAISGVQAAAIGNQLAIDEAQKARDIATQNALLGAAASAASAGLMSGGAGAAGAAGGQASGFNQPYQTSKLTP